jgi:predicted transcriptional regulator
MTGAKHTNENTTWVTVPLDDALHGEVRAIAVKAHLTWPAVVAQAMRLWLAQQQNET